MNKICLVGNPNCGKTTLFNLLTGTYQKVGNWSGVTTEKKEGVYKENKNIKLVDLPGIYSMSAISKDESAVIEFLKNNKDVTIINVVDGTNLERHLFLTAKLIQLGLPMMIAINFYDELKKNDIKLNIEALEQAFGVKILPISAKKQLNVDKIINVALSAVKPELKAYKRFKDKNAKQIYDYLDENVQKFISSSETKAQQLTLKLDNFLIGKYTGIPFFVLVIFLIYFLSSKAGSVFGGAISDFFTKLSQNTALTMSNVGLPIWSISLFANAVVNGVGSVLAFTPQILTLFFLMSIIEESGYASRVTFLFDKMLRGIGLGGKSVIPLILSCGCTVTGVMATRTIESEHEKKMTLYLAPFMPCGAKMVVFAWFSQVFFNGSPFVSVSMYFISILAVVIFGLILNRKNKRNSINTPFVLEMPTLRCPTIKNIGMVLWEKAKDFTVKSGTVILAVSVVTWFLINFGFKGFTNGRVEQSFLYYVGNVLKYLFKPLGFGTWQASASLLSGIFAKEAVIESILQIERNYLLLFEDRIAVYSFMTFVLLSPPCVASISTLNKEIKSKKELLKVLLFQFASAYTVSLFINLVSLIAKTPFLLILSAICVIITVLWAVIALIKGATEPCKAYKCSNCGVGKCRKNLKRNTTI